jgi:hypothetical protein
MLGDAHHLGYRPGRERRLATPALGDDADSIDPLFGKARPPSPDGIGVYAGTARDLLVAETLGGPQQRSGLHNFAMRER